MDDTSIRASKDTRDRLEQTAKRYGFKKIKPYLDFLSFYEPSKLDVQMYFKKQLTFSRGK